MMTIGVGGSSAREQLEYLATLSRTVAPIKESEFSLRIEKAVTYMNQFDIAAVYLNAGTNLYYFTGTRWGNSERMVGALLTNKGELHYIAPVFEISTLSGYLKITGEIHGWHEHESPYELFSNLLMALELSEKTIALDESSPFFITNGLANACQGTRFVDAKTITANCRMRKSHSEIALMQSAMTLTLNVQKAAARILREGISTKEVADFIDDAHKVAGAPAGSYFCIVLFGEDSAYPHGVRHPQNLSKGNMVLIDTGCQLEGYNSDITRSYVFGEPTDRDREVWNHEKASQAAGFKAAQLGVPCGNVDKAARGYLESLGYGPGYETPGLAHRTGHGIGLDIHEWPYLVSSDRTALDVGMCFSNEPMISIPGEFGIRLEDHFYMTEDGAKWFTHPSKSIEDPFALGSA